MTQQIAPRMEAGDAALYTTPHGAHGCPSGNRRGARARAARVALAFGVAASLAAGGWGLFSSLGAEATPARVGEPVEVPGGLVRVDKVTAEHMAQMQADKFAASGMSMSSMGMDMAPEGQRRFAVDVSLAADDGTLSYSVEDFRLTAEGMEEAGPVRDALESETIPAGGAISGTLIFQAPEDVKGLELTFDGGRPIDLDLPPATQGEGHGHGASAKGQGNGSQEDSHDH
jgi:hypothetical protein